MRRVVAVFFAVVAVTGCGASDGAFGDAPDPAPDSAPDTATTVVGPVPAESGPPDGVVDFGEFPRDHVGENVVYDETPPVGGPHLPIWQTCDFYDEPVPNERGVHSLEHGAVWITFDPGLDGDQVDVIRGLADGTREELASPFEGLPSPVVASAWGVQLQLDDANDPRLAQFADYYENGPQTPEANTPCAGGAP